MAVLTINPLSPGEPNDPSVRRQTIRELLAIVFPDGTNHEVSSGLETAPMWAPDLFAAMAILIEQSGCYTHPQFMREHAPLDQDTEDTSTQSDGKRASRSHDFEEIARGYRHCWRSLRKDCSDPSVCSYANGQRIQPSDCGWKVQYACIQSLWTMLARDCGDKEVGSVDDLRQKEPPQWYEAAMELLKIADEACVGVGFTKNLGQCKPEEANPIAYNVYVNQLMWCNTEHIKRPERVVHIQDIEKDYSGVKEELEKIAEKYGKAEPRPLKLHLPHSICSAVPPYVACVQPKANTPQVGYSLRSFSHNLALVPRVGEVSTQWFNSFAEEKTDNPLNLLLIPYPYSISAKSFTHKKDDLPHTFSVEQFWLEELLTQNDIAQVKSKVENEQRWPLRQVDFRDRSQWRRAELQAEKIQGGISALIKEAHRNIMPIHGVILPELSLSYEIAEIASRDLFTEFSSDLQFFISGVMANRQASGGGRRINSVFTRLNIRPDENHPEKAVGLRRIQVKHHRWKLDELQIIRYRLGSQLDPEHKWWENTDMIERESLFWVFRPYMVMASLVCEDLARIDPVQRVLRAVAPNLVVALLLDGAQSPTRWASRYAGALAEDPGCGVLTLTCLGMVRRDSISDGKEHQIAMWKDTEGRTTPLSLPKGAAALVVTLSTKKMRELAADGRQRSEGSESRKLYLSAVHPIATPPFRGRRGEEENTMFAPLDRMI